MQRTLRPEARVRATRIVWWRGGFFLSLVVSVGLLLGAQGAYAQADEQPFDTERGILLEDRDGDGYPDLTERRAQTDPDDAEDYPGRPAEEEAEAQAGGFPTAACRPGFRQAGPRLCVSLIVQPARQYDTASVLCRDLRSHVCTYEDLYYLYVRSTLDASYNPFGRWIGNIVADDFVLCGGRSITFNNDPDIENFERTCLKIDVRGYFCCHDDES